jgi:predicted HTH domain antitoxin
MKQISIPFEINADLMLSLNLDEQEIKSHLKLMLAMMLYQKEKLTLGKAIELSGISRYEFEKSLLEYKIPFQDQSLDDINADVSKI